MFAFLFQITILSLIIYSLFKGKQLISKLWGSLDSTTKLKVVERPTHYRTYSPYIELCEIVHWEVVPAMGESISIIRSDFPQVVELLTNKDNSTVTMGEIVSRWDAVGKTIPNYQLIRVFFETAVKHTNQNQRYELAAVLNFIKVAI